MKVLRLNAADGLYLPCKYCGSVDCKLAPLKPGKTDSAYPFPWTRANPSAEFSSARVELTPCERAAYKEHGERLKEIRPQYWDARKGILLTGRVKTEEESPKKKPVQQKLFEEDAPKPVLTARQTAEAILRVCDKVRGITAKGLCSLAGIEFSDLVTNVLAYLHQNGKIELVMGRRWRLKKW